MRITRKPLGMFLAGLATLALGLWVVSILPTKPQPSHFGPVSQLPSYAVAPETEQLGAELGIPEQNLSTLHAHFGDAGTVCGKSWALGCFNGELVISPKAPREEQRLIMAHEYLHWVWRTQMTPQQKMAVEADILTLYNRYPDWFNHRMEVYTFTVGDETFYNELHSYMGTEVDDSKIPPALMAHYRQWLPNRAVLPSHL